MGSVFTRGQFWPSGIVVACVCVCVCVCVCLSVCLCVNHLLVRAITRDPFKLGSPNLDRRCKRPWLGRCRAWINEHGIMFLSDFSHCLHWIAVVRVGWQRDSLINISPIIRTTAKLLLKLLRLLMIRRIYLHAISAPEKSTRFGRYPSSTWVYKVAVSIWLMVDIVYCSFES